MADVTKRKNMFIWPGECHVHAGIRAEDVNRMLSKFKDADFLIIQNADVLLPLYIIVQMVIY